MGLSPRQQKILELYDFHSLDESLFLFPSNYHHYAIKPVEQWEAGDVVIFEGQLASAIQRSFLGGKRSVERFSVLNGDALIHVVAYNRRFLKESMFHERIVVVAKVEGSNRVTAINVNGQPLAPQLEIQSIYPLKEGVKQHEIRRLIDSALKSCPLGDDVIPEFYRERYKLLYHGESLRLIHRPSSEVALQHALRTLKYEEFLAYQCQMLLDRQRLRAFPKPPVKIDQVAIEACIETLPFALSADQRQALQEILDDLSSDVFTNRLLQGDVGSGKTIVALLAAYAMILNHRQVAFMVPTDILANQHMQSAVKLFGSLPVRVGLLTGSQSGSEGIRSAISSHDFDLVIGTHALYQDAVEFADLGLLIIDEQHRFGVNQRAALFAKAKACDRLMLSATPIPRTLANVLYKNISVSTLANFPWKQGLIATQRIAENSVRSIMDDLRSVLRESQQIYVVCAAIDANEQHVQNVVSLTPHLQAQFKPYQVTMLHGRMSSDEKKAIMDQFGRNEIQVLVATSLIEVGIDVPNATRMIIYDADRFGLSTLHQLRGRIGRGFIPSICYVLTKSKDEVALARLDNLVTQHDGFILAQKDLKQRGPGDLSGVRQSGLPQFMIGDFFQDQKIMETASVDAQALFEQIEDPQVAAFFQRIVSIKTLSLD